MIFLPPNGEEGCGSGFMRGDGSRDQCTREISSHLVQYMVYNTSQRGFISSGWGPFFEVGMNHKQCNLRYIKFPSSAVHIHI